MLSKGRRQRPSHKLSVLSIWIVLPVPCKHKMFLSFGEIFSDGCDAATGAASIRSLKRNPLRRGRRGPFSMQGSTVSAEIADAGSSYIFSGALQPMRVMAFFSTARVVSASFSRASTTGFSSPLMRQAA